MKAEHKNIPWDHSYVVQDKTFVGGAVITNDAAAFDRLKFLQNAIGAVPGPLDCFLVLRGTKTLAIRMNAHCENAMAVSRFLADHPDVQQVRYPGLESDPGHAIAARQMSGFGGGWTMLSLPSSYSLQWRGGHHSV